MYVTAIPFVVLPDEKVPQAVPVQFDPLADQFTALPSVVFGVTDNVCVIVKPASFGATETVRLNDEIVSVKFTVCVCAGLLESLTLKVSGVALTGAVGVPLIAPVAAFSDSPAGNVPLVNDQL